MSLNIYQTEDVIRYLLILLGLGVHPSTAATDVAWKVNVNSEPDTPDDVITIYGVGEGPRFGRDMPTGEQNVHDAIQVRVRSSKQTRAYEKAREIARKFDYDIDHNGVTINGVSYLVHSINRTSEPAHLGKQSPTSHRDLYTFNATVAISQLS